MSTYALRECTKRQFSDKISDVPVNPIYTKGWTETTGCSYCPFHNRLEVLKETHHDVLEAMLRKSESKGILEMHKKLRTMLMPMKY